MNASKRLIVGAAVAGGLMIGAAALVIGAGLAHADPYDFTADMTSAGMVNGDGAAAQLDVGQMVCRELNSGWTPAQVTRQVWLGSELNDFQAGELVGIAVRDLCPWDAQPFDGPPSTVA